MHDWTIDYKEQTEASADLEYFDPNELTFIKRGDAVSLTLSDDRSYLRVHVVRAFPLTKLDKFIGLFDAISGREIGMLKTLRDFDPQTRTLLQQELDKRYFIPKIRKITQAKKEFGTIYWTVDTDRGTRDFILRGIRDSIHEVEPGRYLISDVDGNRFEIPQLADLDARSQTLWDRVI